MPFCCSVLSTFSCWAWTGFEILLLEMFKTPYIPHWKEDLCVVSYHDLFVSFIRHHVIFLEPSVQPPCLSRKKSRTLVLKLVRNWSDCVAYKWIFLNVSRKFVLSSIMINIFNNTVTIINSDWCRSAKGNIKLIAVRMYTSFCDNWIPLSLRQAGERGKIGWKYVGGT